MIVRDYTFTGVTTGTTTAKHFDDYFIKNYKLLITKSNYFFKKYGQDEVTDQLTEAYLKIKKRIIEKGYEGENFTAYVYSTLFNQFRHKKNLEKKARKNNIHYEDFQAEELQEIIHHKLQLTDDFHSDDFQYQDDIRDIANKILVHINKNYTSLEVSLFLQYCLTKDNYQTISERTGLSKNYIAQVMAFMNGDIQNKFGRWRISIDTKTEINRDTGAIRTYKHLTE